MGEERTRNVDVFEDDAQLLDTIKRREGFSSKAQVIKRLINPNREEVKQKMEEDIKEQKEEEEAKEKEQEEMKQQKEPITVEDDESIEEEFEEE